MNGAVCGPLRHRRLAAGMDESEQPPIHDAGRRAAAPLIRGVFAAPDFRLIRIDPPSFANACRALASLKRTGSRLFVCQGARCPSLTLVRLAVADTIALGGESEHASRCRSTARSRKPLSAVRSTVGSNPTPSAAKPISRPGAGDLDMAKCVRPLTGRVNERQRTSLLASVHSPAIPPAGPIDRAGSPTSDAVTSVTEPRWRPTRGTALGEEPRPAKGLADRALGI
jgi:hypothetical protein